MEYSESRAFSEMIDFISHLLVVEPEKRMSAKEALEHPWLKEASYQCNRSPVSHFVTQNLNRG